MIKDLQNDIVPVSELEKAMYNFMDRGGHILRNLGKNRGHIQNAHLPRRLAM